MTSKYKVVIAQRWPSHIHPPASATTRHCCRRSQGDHRPGSGHSRPSSNRRFLAPRGWLPEPYMALFCAIFQGSFQCVLYASFGNSPWLVGAFFFFFFEVPSMIQYLNLSLS